MGSWGRLPVMLTMKSMDWMCLLFELFLSQQERCSNVSNIVTILVLLKVYESRLCLMKASHSVQWKHNSNTRKHTPIHTSFEMSFYVQPMSPAWWSAFQLNTANRFRQVTHWATRLSFTHLTTLEATLNTVSIFLCVVFNVIFLNKIVYSDKYGPPI